MNAKLNTVKARVVTHPKQVDTARKIVFPELPVQQCQKNPLIDQRFIGAKRGFAVKEFAVGQRNMPLNAPPTISPTTSTPSPSPKDWTRYQRVIRDSLGVTSPLDLFSWLQGELQYFLPHEILIAAWGDFAGGNIRYDVVSVPQESAQSVTSGDIVTLLRQLHERWVGFRRSAFQINCPEIAASSDDSGDVPPLRPLRGMQSALVHGIRDERNQQDWLYVTMHSDRMPALAESRKTLELLLPYIDSALRRISPLPQKNKQKSTTVMNAGPTDALSNRESEILEWVRKGKTNQEIGIILGISAYTVKNHLQRIFRKLDVYSRAQAVGKMAAANNLQNGNSSHG